MYLICRLCFAVDGRLEFIYNIEESLISTINEHLFEVKFFLFKRHEDWDENSIFFITVK